MNIEELRQYCLSKPGTDEAMPFDDNALVFRVMKKMFAITGLKGDLRINLKCDPDKALELREQYPAVIPGYHMSKKHWNTVAIDGSIDTKLICSWIDDSYDLVASSLKKAEKEALKNL